MIQKYHILIHFYLLWLELKTRQSIFKAMHGGIGSKFLIPNLSFTSGDLKLFQYPSYITPIYITL